MSAQIIDGKAFAVNVRQKVAAKVSDLKAAHGITPGLAVVLVGTDPASQVYVKSKGKQTVEVGMNSFEHKFDADISEDVLLELIDTLNADPAVHGIWCNCHFLPILMTHWCLTASPLKRMSTAFTLPMLGFWERVKNRWCPVHRLDVC